MEDLRSIRFGEEEESEDLERMAISFGDDMDSCGLFTCTRASAIDTTQKIHLQSMYCVR